MDQGLKGGSKAMSEVINRKDLDELRPLLAKGGKYDLTTEAGREAYAVKVLERVNLLTPAVDIVSFLLDVDNSFGVGDTIQWWDLDGVTVYQHEPGSYVPRSKLVKKTSTATPDFYSAAVSQNMVDLESGRYGGLATVQDKMVDRLVGKRSAVLWALLKTTIPSTAANYTSVAANLDATSLNLAIEYVADKSKKAKAIIGRRLALKAIFGFTGALGADWSPATRQKFEMEGYLGEYRGVPVIMLPDFKDENQMSLIDNANVFVVGDGLGRIATTIPLFQKQWQDNDTLEWVIRMSEEYAMALFDSDRKAFRIQIT